MIFAMIFTMILKGAEWKLDGSQNRDKGIVSTVGRG